MGGDFYQTYLLENKRTIQALLEVFRNIVSSLIDNSKVFLRNVFLRKEQEKKKKRIAWGMWAARMLPITFISKK